jgi:hypothetical protein
MMKGGDEYDALTKAQVSPVEVNSNRGLTIKGRRRRLTMSEIKEDGA